MGKVLTIVEGKHLETIKLWLDSMRDWIAFMAANEEIEIAVDGTAPLWVKDCAMRIDRSLFAPVNAVLAKQELTPYRLGYALGLMKWGSASMSGKAPLELKSAVKGIRLAKKARRQLVRMVQEFFISVKILVRKNGRIKIPWQRELNYAERMSKKYTGRDESDFHRGLSDGLRGVGRDVPGDRSTDATDVYLSLVIWWRFVVRFSSVTQLHAFLVRCHGASRVGEKKRIEKICERIGLTLREPGRPSINPTLALPG